MVSRGASLRPLHSALLLAALWGTGNAQAANPSDVSASEAAITDASLEDPEAGDDGDAPQKRRQCKPKHDKHGVWAGSTEPGGEYVLTCDPGYAVAKERTVTLTCSEDEVQWNADPWCENVDDCAERMYGCGPAGLCVDHVGHSECICERGAVVRTMSNGEEVCYFKNETKHCGGRNCGAHGICVDLTQYQQSFDTGDSSFRCSCERGFRDDGSTCKPVNCGERFDQMGTWTGSSTYLGEYTLECNEGAFVLGGTQKAITVSCPADGRWESNTLFRTHPPKCLSPTQALHDAHLAAFRFWLNIVMSLCCICGAATAAGLTMGLLSLEPREMEIIQRARLHDCIDDKERERLEKQKDAARHILPLIKDHHLLLVTLLLLNALANEALPIFLDQLVSPVVAVLLSVTFVLMCGEILPSAVFTGPLQLTISSMFIPCVRVLLCALYVIAKPIAVALDNGLPHKSAEEELYSRPEIRAVLTLHSQGPEGCASRTAASSRPESASSQQGLIGSEPLFDQESPPADSDAAAPLDPLEAQICFGVLDLGELQVAESQAFRSLRRCSSAFHAAMQSECASSAAYSAATAGAEAVVVFRSLELVKWPIEVPLEELLGVLRLPDLLVAPSGATLAELCVGQSVAQVEATETVTNALCALSNACGTPCSFAAVIQRCEFMGLLDGEDALVSLLTTIQKQESSSSLGLSPQALPREAADAVREALSGRGEMEGPRALEAVMEDADDTARRISSEPVPVRPEMSLPGAAAGNSGGPAATGAKREQQDSGVGAAPSAAATATPPLVQPELPGALAASAGQGGGGAAGQDAAIAGVPAASALPAVAAAAAAGAPAAVASLAAKPGPSLPSMPEVLEEAAPPAASAARDLMPPAQEGEGVGAAAPDGGAGPEAAAGAQPAPRQEAEEELTTPSVPQAAEGVPAPAAAAPPEEPAEAPLAQGPVSDTSEPAAALLSAALAPATSDEPSAVEAAAEAAGAAELPAQVAEPAPQEPIARGEPAPPSEPLPEAADAPAEAASAGGVAAAAGPADPVGPGATSVHSGSEVPAQQPPGVIAVPEEHGSSSHPPAGTGGDIELAATGAGGGGEGRGELAAPSEQDAKAEQVSHEDIHD